MSIMPHLKMTGYTGHNAAKHITLFITDMFAPVTSKQ